MIVTDLRGRRVRLTAPLLGEEEHRAAPQVGDEGEVLHEYAEGALLVKWDSGIRLGLLKHDSYTILSDDHPSEIKADAIVDAIIANIKESPDSFVAAGEWITKITNAITNQIREEDKK